MADETETTDCNIVWTTHGTCSGGTVTVACQDVVWTVHGGNLGPAGTGRHIKIPEEIEEA